MNNYDIGPGNGLAKLDETLSLLNPGTGKPFNVVKALDELTRMACEVDAIIYYEMQNIPPAVVNSLRLLAMATGCLAAIVRARVVTEPMEAAP